MKNMHRYEMQQIIIYLNKYFLEFYFLVKIKVLQTYPLKMNLVLEIQTDRKRNLETPHSILLLFPK
jgi:hypothetical protein